MSEKQIYIVQIDGGNERLIEARNKKAAILFALPIVIQAEKATASEVAQLMANGVKLEKAE